MSNQSYDIMINNKHFCPKKKNGFLQTNSSCLCGEPLTVLTFAFYFTVNSERLPPKLFTENIRTNAFEEKEQIFTKSKL